MASMGDMAARWGMLIVETIAKVRRKRSVTGACRWATIGVMIGGWQSKQNKCPLPG